jgi:two-component system response regulator HydG
MAEKLGSGAERILVVDDDQDACWILSEVLRNEGYETVVANDGRTAIRAIANRPHDLVLLDMKLPEMDGFQVIEEIKRLDRDQAVIMLTAYGEIKDAVKAVRLGAADFITKPFVNRELVRVIRNVLSSRPGTRGLEPGKSDIEGVSGKMRLVMDHVEAVAKTNLTVVLQGESGTGKELVARMIHEKSLRRDRSFVAIDCGTLTETLAESELFGYEKGAFTGAAGKKEGQFEFASGGTLFLDEVTNLSERVQMKLLRVLQERRVRRLGGSRDLKIDVRVIAATNIDFREYVRLGRFRSDLYFRLNEFTIELPPLRQRVEDIPVLSEYFLKEACGELGKNIKGLADEVIEAFMKYGWPGNIRELRNVVRRAVFLAHSDHMTMENLPAELTAPSSGLKKPSHGESLRGLTKAMTVNAEREMIKKALAETGHNKSKAARLLKIDRTTLYSKLKAMGID